MDLWGMLGLSPRQGLFLAASGLVVAAVVARRAFARRAREEPQRDHRSRTASVASGRHETQRVGDPGPPRASCLQR